MCLTISVLQAQSYLPFQTHQENYYLQKWQADEDGINDDLDWIVKQDDFIVQTHFDSVEFNGTDSIYYPAEILNAVPYYLYQDSFVWSVNAVYQPAHWCGQNLIYDSINEVAELVNRDGQTIQFHLATEVDEPFLMMNTNDGDSVIAWVDSLGTDIILGEMDSLKFIAVAVYNSEGELEANLSNDFQFVLSKNHGLIRFPSLASFPKVLSYTYELSGNRTLGVKPLTVPEAFDVEVGSIVQYRTNMTYITMPGADYYIEREYLAKEDDWNLGTRKIKWIERIFIDNYGYFETDPPKDSLYDSLIVSLDEVFVGKQTYDLAELDYYPLQSINSLTSLNGELPIRNHKTYTRNLLHFEPTFFTEGVADLTLELTDVYYEGFGRFKPSEHFGHITYIQNSSLEWGEPFDFNTIGVEENQINDYVLFPNPASNIIYGVPSNAHHIMVYDLTGKVVNAKVLESNYIEVSRLSKGVYFVQFELDHQVKNVKVFVN